VNAKVEGRDPPEKAKETMGTFRALTKRLLKVRPEEFAEQQRLYDNARATQHLRPMRTKKKAKLERPWLLDGMNDQEDKCR
jgi:hypothetical protein